MSEICMNGSAMSVAEKLAILTDAAKYDVACTSSGVDRAGKGDGIGNAIAAGICHSFAADGRCISLLKILFTNECVFDCKYCINRRSNDIVRTSFTPVEVAELTMEFYRRNYIEGLFLSSGVRRTPDDTMEQLYETLRLLREEYHFNGYIHVKAIPGADEDLVARTGFLADRMSINLELPTREGLEALAPNKTRTSILKPMKLIQLGRQESQYRLEGKKELSLLQESQFPAVRKKEKVFVPAGQSTQVIVGATPESDYQIVKVAESLYQNFDLKRVFYSAFVNVTGDKSLPVLPGGPPLLREHRLYQADWLLRFYGFKADELLTEKQPNFNLLLDPKCNWALNHMEVFPVEINKAPYPVLLRIPGIGVKSAKRILAARKGMALDFPDLKKIGVVLKRAQYFITCKGKMFYPYKMEPDYILDHMLDIKEKLPEGIGGSGMFRQLSLFDDMHLEVRHPMAVWR